MPRHIASICTASRPTMRAMRLRKSVRPGGVARGCGALAVMIGVLVASRAAALEIPVAEYRLKNGLRLLVHEDHATPVAASYLFYRSGSGNEQIGQTGMAHLFEHMMFNGSKKYGAGTFDNLLEGAGGSTNGYTTRDFTVYLNNFPPEALELVLDLEADRMANLLITAENLEQERGIVKEERRLRIDNNPMAAMDEQLYLQAFTASPYRWSVIGFMADLEAITLSAAREYFSRYYVPNNATLVLAGDIDADAAYRAVAGAFGKIPRGELPSPVVNQEPVQIGARQASVHRPAELPAVLIGYHAPAATSADRPALDVLDAVLSSGEASRLYRRLVYERELATTVWTSFNWLRHPGLFLVYAQARPGRDIGEVTQEVSAVLSDLVRKPPDERELRKAKNILLTHYVRGMKTAGGKANRLGYYNELFGDYRALFTIQDQWESVTAANVVRAAETYLTPRNGTTVVLVPEPRT